MEKAKDQAKVLKDRLFLNPAPAYNRFTETQRAQAEALSVRYKAFLDAGKTERDCCRATVALAEEAGFMPLLDAAPKPGDKVYFVNRDRSVTLAVMGRRPLSEGMSLVAAHIDCPRIDLKQNPLYEDSDIALLKTHYYGGIKKYQWTALPLELRGVLYRRDGTAVRISIGADPDDPVFTITDLLPHLAKDQMKKTMAEGVEGEALNALAGSYPDTLDPDGSDRVKLALLRLLNDKYGVTEADFRTAELSLVPAINARDVGFDKSMIGAYGHDDRSCAYAAVAALLSADQPEYTAVCLLADKEEIGSEGVSGMQSEAFETFVARLGARADFDRRLCFEKSLCLSSDVMNAFDPTYASVSDKRNNALLGYGLGLAKFTGSRGKSGSSDASAEVVSRVGRLLDAAGVPWQTGELGRVDQGGGGTVACYLASRNIDVIDAGIPVLSMHAPFEVISKMDLYAAHLAYAAFYNRKD